MSLNRKAAAVKEIGEWLFLRQVQIITESIKMNKKFSVVDFNFEVCEMFLNQ